MYVNSATSIRIYNEKSYSKYNTVDIKKKISDLVNFNHIAPSNDPNLDLYISIYSPCGEL